MASFSFKFYLKEGKDPNIKSPIYIRVTVKRKKSELFTGLKSLPKDWNSDRGRSIKNVVINEHLNDIENRLYDGITKFNKANKSFTSVDLKTLLIIKSPIEKMILDYFQDYISRLTKANEIEKSTIKSYGKAKEYLAEFISSKYEKVDFPLSKLNFSFISDFDLFMLETGLARNTITKHQKKLKSVVLHAQREQLLPMNPFQEFKLKSTAGTRQFLTQPEVDLIENHPLAENESLKKVRDIFIFSVYTGLRFTDAINLKMTDVKTENDGSKYITLSQEKTGELLTIPLLPKAFKIIEAYDKTERKITGKVLPVISNQKLNSYLKTIGELCGIDKPLTHHIARHTCATTILLSNKVPIEAVSKWLGHTSIKTTQVYAKISHEYLKNIAIGLGEKY